MTKIAVTAETITLPVDFPVRPKEADVWPVMEAISESLGVTYGAVKMGRWWIIGDASDGKWRPIFGGNDQPTSTLFTEALAIAFGRKVVRA